MDRLHEMEVFIAVADAGSFAKAGTRLRISPPAVTRAVSSLEERIGARLLNVLKGSVIRQMVIVVLLFAGLRALLKGLGIWA